MPPRLRPRNPLGSWLLGSGTEGGRRLRWRVQLLLTTLLVLANGIGAFLVTVLLWLVIPGRDVLTKDLAWVNFVWGPVYSITALVVGGTWGTVSTMRTLRWSREDRPATRRERIATLRLPWTMTLVSGVLWVLGTAFMTFMYTRVHPDLVWKTGFTIAFAGAVVCANAYLLTEFALRPVAARALASSPPRRAAGVGITWRALLIGAYGALPVAGLMILALFQLAKHQISADDLGRRAFRSKDRRADEVDEQDGDVAHLAAELHLVLERRPGDVLADVAPEDHPDAAGRALAAARRMAKRLHEEVPDALAGIGVSAGPAVAGNVGAEDRFEYTVIGDPVNEAARLTEEAKQVEGRVVASMRAVEAASPEEAARWEPLREVSLRGRAQPTMLAVPSG